MTMASTLAFDASNSRVWDAAVIGAGPAGALAARELARRGASVLLVDQQAFPRRKVCGGCLNATALDVLNSVGLGSLPGRLGARPLRDLVLIEGRQRVRLSLPGGAAVSRDAFDAAMLQEAILAGADFLPQTTAEVDRSHSTAPWRRVALRRGEQGISVEARIVLEASGLRGGGARRAPRSRIGVGTVVGQAPSWCCDGALTMVCGSGGYVGLVQLEDGRLNVAAAFDPARVRSDRGAGAVATAILARAGLSVAGLSEASWSGTPPLTRRRDCVSEARLFVIGDAAGYVEPFTGEGIASALWCGAAVAPLALEGMRGWTPALSARWDALYQAQVGRRQWACRLVSAALRRSVLTRAAITALSWMPSLAGPIIRWVEAPLPLLPSVAEGAA